MVSLLLALTLAAHAADPKLEAALDTALTYRAGLQRVLNFVETRPDLFPTEKLAHPRWLSSDAKQEIRNSWKSILDYTLALDSLQRAYGRFWTLKRDGRPKALEASFAAYAAQLRFALDFIDRVENDPALHPLLDEAVPDLGLPKGSYAHFKARFRDEARAAELAAYETLQPGQSTAVKTDLKRLRGYGKPPADELSERQALKILQKGGALLPVPAGVAEWIGDASALRPGRPLDGALLDKLEPGDILLSRNESYLTNIGLTGFWTHAALYAGEGRALEAVAKGVVLSTASGADWLAVLRPRLPPERKAEAVTRARALLERPYDYDFDFRTDAAILCTELVHKAYEPELRLPLEDVIGRVAASANLIARKFDFEHGTTEQQLELIAFFDGAKEGTVEDFRKSWLRPKWRLSR